MARKIRVDADACIGCGACAGVAPEVFEMNDEGKSVVVADPAEDAVDELVSVCPVAAIVED
ncbi:MAG: ferredoxin [Bacilli bacterium]|nr:ferredoxin [Bacilli bacterium]